MISDFHEVLRATSYHGPWSWTMEDGLFPWSNFMVQFLKNSTYKAIGPFTRCKSNVDREEWPCIKKMNMLILEYIYIYVQKWEFWINKIKVDHSLVFSFLHLLFPQKNSLKFYLNNISLQWVLAARGDHTPLHFVTTCDNGVFNGGGLFMHLSIFFPPYL